MQSLLKRKFFLILKRFFRLFALSRRSSVGAKSGVLAVAIAIAAAIFLLPSAVNALGDMETISGGLMQGLSKMALGLGEFFIKMSIFFLRFFIALAQYNNYIDSPVVKLGWLMVRDVVNMFFVVILLVIAIGTILGIEQYQWNKTLVKLILSAVFVNFSNLICQLFIDAAHIFTLTFASAISATAGGNLINMFHFEKIYAIVTGKNDIGIGGENFDMMGRTLVASIVAMLFALLAMLVMGAYAIMMLLRMTVLWVLIILSPMAFLFIALPQTTNRYAEWWKEFSNYVVLGPTIAFFMWLAFATAGSGTLGSDIGITDDMLQAGSIDSVGALTLSAVTTWENMANFLVAIVLLFVGLQEVQKLNVAGGSVASKAKDFFGKVATIATGYAAGRWLVGASGKVTGGAVKGALWHMPLGGETWAEHAKLVWNRTKTAWYVGAGAKGELLKEDKLGKAMRGAFGWNIGRLAGRTARRKKHLRAAEKTTEAGEELISKQQSSGQWGNRARNIRGRLEAYEERSKHRDAEGVAESKEKELMAPRYKDGTAYVNPETGEVSTLAGESARFAMKQQKWEESEKGLLAEERQKILKRAEPDIQKANEESRQAREEQKSSELRAAEGEERGIKDKLRPAEAKISVEVDKKLKGDAEVVRQRTEMEYAKEKVGKIETELGKLKANANYAELVSDREDKTTAEEALEKIRTRLLDPEKKLTPADRGKLEQMEKVMEKKVVELDDKILKNAEGASADEEIKQREEERQTEKNKAEDLQDVIDKKKKEEVKKMENEAVIEGELTVAEQRKKYEEAQKKTTKAREEWEKIADAAAKNPKPTFATEKEEDQWQEQLAERRKRVAQMTSDERRELEIDEQRERDAVTKQRLKEIDEDLFDGSLKDKDGRVVMANGKEVLRKDSNTAISYIKAVQRAATAGAGVEAIETEMRKIALGLESFGSMFSAEVASKMGAEASKAFIDGIKEKKMGELFKKGANELKKALEEAGEKGIKLSLEELRPTTVGAKMAQAQMIQEFHKDITIANKAEAADHATDIFTLERYGFKTPSSAFKNWVKKQTEGLQGVEREQSVINAMGTLGQFFKLQKQGKEITTDQKAQMMAHLKHLTSNGWMDDLLARVAKMATSVSSLTGEKREEAQALQDIFIDRLKWDPKDNRSGADRTAQLQKLVGMGGDMRQMQAEEAVLWRMENTGEGYGEASRRLAEKTKDNQARILDSNVTVEEKIQMAKDAGLLTAEQIEKFKDGDARAKAAVEASINQLAAYTEGFVKPFADLPDSAEKAAQEFKKSMEQFTDAFEMLADFKNLAMNTGHIDDGGHTYYDMDEQLVRGNLGHKGKAFVLGEWRKLGLDQRLSRLKTHSTGQMQEDWGTIDYTAGEECNDAIRETFAGLSNQREFAKVDGRNKDHMAGMAAGEAARLTADGRTKIGDDDSVYFRGTFKHIDDKNNRRKAVKERLRGNYAAFLRNNPAALFGSLAERSGLSFDDGMKGNINMNICGENISNVEDLVRWVNSDPSGGYRFNAEHIRRSLARAAESKGKKDND